MRSFIALSLAELAVIASALPTFSPTGDDEPARRRTREAPDVETYESLLETAWPTTDPKYYPFTFCKTMKHRKQGHGFCEKADVEVLRKLIDNTDEILDPISNEPRKRIESDYLASDIETIVQQGDDPSDGTARKPWTIEGLANPFSGCECGRNGQCVFQETAWMRHGQPSSIKPQSSTDTQMAYEMGEVYAMGILRDLPFNDWSSEDAEESSSLHIYRTFANTFPGLSDGAIKGVVRPLEVEGTDGQISQQVTVGTLFRGMGHGETTGGFVSQLLLQDLKFNGLVVEQMYPEEPDAANSLTEVGWLKIQNGREEECTVDGEQRRGADCAVAPTAMKYVHNMRMLGSIVHNDLLYQIYYNAALILLDKHGCKVTPVGLEGEGHDVKAWLDGGTPDVLSALASVSRNALEAAWYNKWKFMRIRPEVYAQRMMACQETKTLCDEIGMRSSFDFLAPLMGMISEKNGEIIADHLLSHQDDDGRFAAQAAALEALKDAKGGGGHNLYLPLMYPEGSPTHPAWPAGHAVVAGACVSVLKAMLSVLEMSDGQGTVTWTEKAWPESSCPAKEASSDGSTLHDAVPSDITIVGELNKLASNVALGRNMAGVHYRSDGDEGILLGEQVAIRFLQERLGKAALKQLHSYFLLSTFGGSIIKITVDKFCLPAGASCKTGDLACPDDTPPCP